MDFYAVVGQILERLQRQGRVSYRALKRQFAVDDEDMADLQAELLSVYPVVDDAGKGLVWTGDPAASEPGIRRGEEAENRFQTALAVVMWLLRRDRRITYRTLKWTFGGATRQPWRCYRSSENELEN